MTLSGRYLYKPISIWGSLRIYSFIILSLFLCYCNSSLLAQSSSSDPKSDKIFKKAKALFDTKDLQASERQLNRILETNPKYIDAYLLKFEIAFEQRNDQKCIENLEKAVKINPNYFTNAHYLLGELNLKSGAYSRAALAFSDFMKYERNERHPLYHKSREGENRSLFAEKLKANPISFDPINLGENINSSNDEYYPTLTTDDMKLLFTRRLFHPGRNSEQEDFYLSEYMKSWSKSQPINDINSAFNEGAPELSADGSLLIFTACAINQDNEYTGNKRGYGSCDLFYSQKIGGTWTPPLNMGKSINSWHWETQASLSANGRTLYFVRGKRAANNPKPKELDIFYSELNENGEWSVAKKMSEVINTSGHESSVMIHPDGETLYFSSDGHYGMGGEDIFVSHREEGQWTTPINLGYPINTHKDENSLTVLASGDIALFASDRAGGFGGLDIYQFELPNYARSEPVSYFKGIVKDHLTKENVSAQIQIFDLASGDLVAESFSDPESGAFLISLPTDKSYALNASALDYLFYSENFDYSKKDKISGVEKTVYLKKLDEGNSLVLENIFFDTDKSELKSTSIPELKKLKEILDHYSELKIEIQGHTDDVGDGSYNLNLSRNRALAVHSWLVENGILAERLSYKGYGEQAPIDTNQTEEGKAKNRRTEVLIVGSN